MIGFFEVGVPIRKGDACTTVGEFRSRIAAGRSSLPGSSPRNPCPHACAFCLVRIEFREIGHCVDEHAWCGRASEAQRIQSWV